MSVRIQTIALIILLLLLSACAAQAAPAPAKLITIVMSEHQFQPDTVRLKAGEQAQIKLVNQGQLEHEFMVGIELERLTWNEQPKEDFFKGIEVAHSEKNGKFSPDSQHGTDVIVRVGGSATLGFTVPTDKKGEWEIGCLIPGHYESGMRGTLIIE